jgi:hypothetical protein
MPFSGLYTLASAKNLKREHEMDKNQQDGIQGSTQSRAFFVCHTRLSALEERGLVSGGRAQSVRGISRQS